MSLTATVATDLVHDAIVVDLHGTLALESVPTVRQILLKSFAQAPEAVIVNVANLHVTSRAYLAVFPTAVRIHGQPTVALLLCSASDELTAMVGGRILGEVPLCATLADALAAVTAAQALAPRRSTMHLAPAATSPAHARRMVADVCDEWGIAGLSGSAVLVVSELVSNAVVHAGTDIILSVALRGDYLHINVRDGSVALPRASPGDLGWPAGPDSGSDHGRGLQLVGIYATAWGARITDVGKIVWATLRASPVRA